MSTVVFVALLLGIPMISNGNKVILDVTDFVNCVQKNCSENIGGLSRLNSAIKQSSELYYNTGVTITAFQDIFSNAKNVLSVLRKAQFGPSNKSPGSDTPPKPKLFLSFRIHEYLAADEELLDESHYKAEEISSVVFDLRRDFENCLDPEQLTALNNISNHFSHIKSANPSSPLFKVGLSIRMTDLDCPFMNFVESLANSVDFVVMQGDMNRAAFVPSFELFSEYWSDNVETMRNAIPPNMPLVIHRSFTEMEGSDATDAEGRMYARFVIGWGHQKRIPVLINASIVTGDEDLVRNGATNPEVWHPENVIAETKHRPCFHTSLGVFTNFLLLPDYPECISDLVKKTCVPSSVLVSQRQTAHRFIALDYCSTRLPELEMQVRRVLHTFPKGNTFIIPHVILNDIIRQNQTGVNSLLREWSEKGVSFAYIMDINIKNDYKLTRPANNKLVKEFFGYIFWEVIGLQSLQDAEWYGYAYVNFVQSFLQPLNRLVTIRNSYVRDNPGTTVILWLSIKLPAPKASWKRQMMMYCNTDVLRLNRYLVAITNWAYLNDILVHYEGVEWWDQLSRPAGLNITNEHETFAVMRNYPAGMSEFTDPCINWSDYPTTPLVLDYLSVGITFASGVVERELKESEIIVMLRYVCHRFSTVNWIFDDTIIMKPSGFQRILNNLKLSSPIHVLIELGKKSLVEYKSVIDILSKAPQNQVSSGGIHISAFQSDATRKDKGQIVNVVRYGLARKVKVGIATDNCTRQLNKLFADPQELAQFHSYNFSYIVCQENALLETNKDGRKMTAFLDSHLVLQNLFRKVLPQIIVYFSVNISPSGKGDQEKAVNYFNLVSDINQFSAAYKVKYILGTAFDDTSNSTFGWWRVEDYVDLSNPFIFVDKLSALTSKKQWYPGRVEEVIKESSLGLTLAISFVALATLVLPCVASIYWFRIRGKVILSLNEVEEFLHGRLEEIDALPDADQSNNYVALGFQKAFEIPKHKFFFDYKVILGMGHFGTVYKAEVRGQPVAVKVPHDSCPKEAFKTMLSEVKVLAHIGEHEHVVGFIGAYTKEIISGKIFIATELCTGGSLEKWLRSRASSVKTGESELLMNSEIIPVLTRFALEISCGMVYISMKKVIHGDLSTRNVFLDDNLRCKIGDFGLSRRLFEYSEYIKKNEEPLPWRWMAPESLRRMEFTTKSDIWSYGVTLWELFSLGDIPYSGLSWSADFVDKLSNGVRLTRPELCVPATFQVVLNCWNIDRDLRPSFEDSRNYFLEATGHNSDYLCTE